LVISTSDDIRSSPGDYYIEKDLTSENTEKKVLCVL